MSSKNLPKPALHKPSDQLRDTIVDGIKEKKGEDVISMDLSAIPEAVTECFVICSADSNVQVKAIGEFVEQQVKERLKEITFHSEGYQNTEWVLLDYINVVVHIFLNEKREHYSLEEIWSDAPITEYNQ